MRVGGIEPAGRPSAQINGGHMRATACTESGLSAGFTLFHAAGAVSAARAPACRAASRATQAAIFIDPAQAITVGREKQYLAAGQCCASRAAVSAFLQRCDPDSRQLCCPFHGNGGTPGILLSAP